MPLLADARTVTEYCVGGVASAREALLASDDPLVGAWKSLCGKLPFAFAVWVAHADTDPDTLEALQYALTYGLERGYEAIIGGGFRSSIRCGPTRYWPISTTSSTTRKNQALKKFWDSGIKVGSEANPG